MGNALLTSTFQCSVRATAAWVLGALVAIAASAPIHAAPRLAEPIYRVISAPDCVDASRMVAEFDAAPVNVTYMRVQHIGDPGTAELLQEVAHAVTWNVGQVTGFQPPEAFYANAQRGFADDGFPDPSSAFQLWCNGAGFWMNSRRFNHAVLLTLEGPSVSVARDLSPPAAVFRNGTSALTIDAQVALPTVQFDGFPVIDGTAQLSFAYYMRDVTSGTIFTHVIALYDNRPAGVNGSGTEAVSADAYNAFVVSPLRTLLADGSPTQYVTVAAESADAHYVAPWKGSTLFRAHVTYAQFKAMLQRLQVESLPAISVRPEDYRVTLFGLLGEIFPGTGRDHEVALGASVTNLRLAEAFDVVAPVPVVEYFNAALGHYFVSARAADLAALDSGALKGWVRTGQSFNTYPVFVEGASPVCRFYLPPASGDSHFYSASPFECAAVAASFPEFIREDDAVMHNPLPDVQSGACAADAAPVYRLWNQLAATNHRYTTHEQTRRQMVEAGWLPEGYGDAGVAMCAPR